MAYPVKVEICEEKVQIFLKLKVLFIQVLRLQTCSVVLFLALKLTCLFSFWFKPARNAFENDFAQMTNEADDFVVYHGCKCSIEVTVIISG